MTIVKYPWGKEDIRNLGDQSGTVDLVILNEFTLVYLELTGDLVINFETLGGLTGNRIIFFIDSDDTHDLKFLDGARAESIEVPTGRATILMNYDGNQWSSASRTLGITES